MAKPETMHPMAARDPYLCMRCGNPGAHKNAEVCITKLRYQVGLLQLALMGKPGAYGGAKQRVYLGKKLAAPLNA